MFLFIIPTEITCRIVMGIMIINHNNDNNIIITLLVPIKYYLHNMTLEV